MTMDEAREYRKFRMRMKRFRRGVFPVMIGERVCTSLWVKANGKKKVKIFPERKYLGKPVQNEESVEPAARREAEEKEKEAG